MPLIICSSLCLLKLEKLRNYMILYAAGDKIYKVSYYAVVFTPYLYVSINCYTFLYVNVSPATLLSHKCNVI